MPTTLVPLHPRELRPGVYLLAILTLQGTLTKEPITVLDLPVTTAEGNTWKVGVLIRDRLATLELPSPGSMIRDSVQLIFPNTPGRFAALQKIIDGKKLYDFLSLAQPTNGTFALLRQRGLTKRKPRHRQRKKRKKEREKKAAKAEKELTEA